MRRIEPVDRCRRLWPRPAAMPRGAAAAPTSAGRPGSIPDARPIDGRCAATCGRPGRRQRRVDRTRAARHGKVRAATGCRHAPVAKAFPRIRISKEHHRIPPPNPAPSRRRNPRRTHRCRPRRTERPPAGGVGQRRLRGDRHHAANRRRAACRGVRPAVRRSRARRRGRQRQCDAGCGAPRLRGDVDRLRVDAARPRRGACARRAARREVPGRRRRGAAVRRTRASTPCCRRSA